MEIKGKKAVRVQTTSLIKPMVDGYYQGLRSARDQGKKVAWCIGPAPFDMLMAADVAFLHLENYAARLSSRHDDQEMRDAAEAIGFVQDTCSYTRVSTGAALLAHRDPKTVPERLRGELMPLPDFIVTAPTCPIMANWHNALARQLKVPGFCLDIPVSYQDNELPDSVTYVTTQLQSFAEFLAQATKRPFDVDAHRAIMALIKEGSQLKLECFDLCKHIPAPMSQFDWFISLAPANILRGRPEAVEYFRKLKAELQQRVAHGISAVPHERHRLYWDHIATWFKLKDHSNWFAAHDAAVVASNYTMDAFYYEPDKIDLDRPLYSVAYELCKITPKRSFECHLKLVEQAVKEYHVDGLVMNSARTCRPFGLGQHDIVRIIEERYDIPGIVIETDHADPSMYSDAQWLSRMEAFMETLDAQPARR